MNYKLDPHQILARDYAVKNPYSILALEMGLGKTPTSLKAWQQLGGNLLVICPAYLISMWQSEIKKWVEGTVSVYFRKGKDFFDLCDTDIAVTSFDLIQKAEHLFEWADMVIVDEAHDLKSMKAKRTAFIHRCIYENSIKRVILLTGTPIPNRVEEFYSLLALMNYSPAYGDKSKFLETFPDSISFADHFSHRREFDMKIGHQWITVVKWEGVKNIAELKSYLKGHYLRIKSDDVLDLPPIKMKDILISDVPDLELKEQFDRFVASDGDSVKPEIKARAALAKVPFTIKYAKGIIDEVGQLPIYSDHVASTEAIADALGVQPITGKISTTRRHEITEKFKSGETRFLVATIGSLKLGVDLSNCNNLIVNDFCWVPGSLNQVYYRIKRRNQKRHCTIHRILGSPQDQQILNALESKSEDIEAAT